ncbi:MAG: putative transcriptional regulator [Planctomycetaceae bacterium]|nr:putative transcriptional regulator [Planctomycetaceae bacterium]
MYAYAMTKTFGDFVREKRDARDLSLREFAKKLGDISPSHISDIENGRRYPSEELLKKMAHLLGVTIADFLKHDVRPRIDELKRLVDRDPIYGVALRKLAEKQVTPEELLTFIESKSKKHG